jgi:hypothetical protein
MFAEMLFNRYSYAKGRRACIPLTCFFMFSTAMLPGFRSERRGAAGGGLFAFSGGFAESQTRQEENKRKDKEEYVKRVEELGKFEE